ncbi:MAG: DnaA regulatory inactivator Hda [Alcanivorax sp.]|nr:DnaA regulatory inactivator Hda [Alcanivorax sp.]
MLSKTFRRAPTCLGGTFDYANKKDRLTEVELELGDPAVWDDPTRAQELGRHACLLPAGELLPLVPDVLESMEQFDLLAVDDVDRFAGEAAWEEALFHLYNRMMARGGTLLFSATAAPGALGWLLPDLATRLAAGPVFRLQPMEEEDLAALLAERARERGLKLGPEVARFMVMRSERSPALLLERLATLDRTALARQRAPTIPFVKDVFGW